VWDDIKWRGDGSALIHLRNTKTRQVGESTWTSSPSQATTSAQCRPC